MRRILMLTVVMLMAMGTLLAPGSTTAQESSPCDAYEPLDTASGVRLRGGSGNQVLIGSNGPDVLRGGSGNDILCGFGGEDTLVGGSGNDFIDGGAGTDVLRGNSGNDTLANGETNRGGSGHDEVFGIAITPLLTVVWALSSSGTGFTGVITGAGLEPGASVVFTAVAPGSQPLQSSLGVVQGDGTFDYFFGVTDCNVFSSLIFSTHDREGNPIATDEPVPC